MKTVKMEIELIYDDKLMHGGDREAEEWFFTDILRNDRLILHSNEIGDEIGDVKVIKIIT